MVVLSAHLGRSNSYPLRPRRVTWVKTKREGVKSGRSSALEPGKLGMSCKANKCSDVETGELGMLPIHETSILLVTLAKLTLGDHHFKYKVSWMSLFELCC